MYDAQGIQQEGRLFEVDEEIGIQQTQRGKGAGGAGGKFKIEVRSKRPDHTLTHLCSTLGVSKRRVSEYLRKGMPDDPSGAFAWFESYRQGFDRKPTDYNAGQWPNLARLAWMVHEVKKHGSKRIFPEWGAKDFAPKRGSGECTRKKRTEDSTKNYWQKCPKWAFYNHWISNEINLHSRTTVFPDWGCLAIRYMENKRRDHKAAYAKRQKKELIYKKQYRQRIEVKQAHAKRLRDKRAADPSYRIRCRLSRRLNEFLSDVGRTKGGSILGYLGCSCEQLRLHLESLFKRGMGWHNYGTHWHVDHILPCSSFDHTDDRQVRQCWHWTNLRPLEARKNISKGNTITHPQMQLLLCSMH